MTKKYIMTNDDVVDNLTTSMSDVPLSANQGRVLNTGKVDKNQGTQYAGKVLGIGSDGYVTIVDGGGLTPHASTHAAGGSDPITPASIGAEPAFTKNNAFNKNFGTASGTVCQGNDSRLSDARTPLAHNQAASTITSGTLSADRLPKASTSAFGAVKVGSGLSVSGGVISVSGGGLPSLNISEGGAYSVPYSTIKLSYSGGSRLLTTYMFPAKVTGSFTVDISARSGATYSTLVVDTHTLSGSGVDSVSTKSYAGSSGMYSGVTVTETINVNNCVSLSFDCKYTASKDPSISTVVLRDGVRYY